MHQRLVASHPVTMRAWAVGLRAPVRCRANVEPTACLSGTMACRLLPSRPQDVSPSGFGSLPCNAWTSCGRFWLVGIDWCWSVLRSCALYLGSHRPIPSTFSICRLPTIFLDRLPLGAIVAPFAPEKRIVTMLLIAGASFSHWILDFAVHIPDVPLCDNTAKVGLGRWRHVALGFPLELALLASALGSMHGKPGLATRVARVSIGDSSSSSRRLRSMAISVQPPRRLDQWRSPHCRSRWFWPWWRLSWSGWQPAQHG